MFQTDVPLAQLERVLCEVERRRGELMHEFDLLQKSPSRGRHWKIASCANPFESNPVSPINRREGAKLMYILHFLQEGTNSF